jgi:hypothetical protein
MPVSRFSVVQKATQLKPEFAEKTMKARMMCVSQFLSQVQPGASCWYTHIAEAP